MSARELRMDFAANSEPLDDTKFDEMFSGLRAISTAAGLTVDGRRFAAVLATDDLVPLSALDVAAALQLIDDVRAHLAGHLVSIAIKRMEQRVAAEGN